VIDDLQTECMHGSLFQSSITNLQSQMGSDMATKTKDLRGMSDEQIGLTLKDTEKHLFQLRFQSATDRLETPSEIRKAKREIARIKTVQRERELVKLGDLPPEQLATRIVSLQAKVTENRPGKRVAFRQAARLKRFHAAKVASKPTGAGATAPKGSGK
jgi:large subunit ribosomal protein L29